MKLTGKLKEKIEKATSREEALDIFEEAGLILTDDELSRLSGGEIEEIGELQQATELILKG